MNYDKRIGPFLFMAGTLVIRSRWRWLPLAIGALYARRWWQIRGVCVNVFRWAFYVGLVRA